MKEVGEHVRGFVVEEVYQTEGKRGRLHSFYVLRCEKCGNRIIRSAYNTSVKCKVCFPDGPVNDKPKKLDDDNKDLHSMSDPVEVEKRIRERYRRRKDTKDIDLIGGSRTNDFYY